MHFRSFVLMGLGALIGMATPVLAETAKAPTKTSLFGSKAAAADEDAGMAKAGEKNPKKKMTAKEKAKAEAQAKADAKKAAREKAAAD